MPRRSGSGLDEATVAALRDRLDARGRAPRVGVSGPQFPAGTTGAVVRIGDPGADGPEYVTVRVKVGPVTDELTFAPSELTATGALARTLAPSPRTAAATPPRPAPAPQKAPAPRKAPTPRTITAPATDLSPPPADSPASARKPAASKTARRGAPPTVSITLTSDGSDWSVTAQRGARTVVRKQAVTPGTVGAIADLLGEDAVSEAVAVVNDSAREQAETRAASLRAELAELDELLAAHRRPGRR